MLKYHTHTHTARHVLAVCIVSQPIAEPQHEIFFEVQTYIIIPPANFQDECYLPQMSSLFFVGDEMKQAIVGGGLNMMHYHHQRPFDLYFQPGFV